MLIAAPMSTPGQTSADGSPSSGDEDIDERIASLRRRIKPTDCLFCSKRTLSIADATSHMAREHSFFVPDQDHLTDLPGLLSYLGNKVVFGNICLYCPNGGKEFTSLGSVRQHMTDKGHCKVAYGTNEDRAELADFYDYRTQAEDEAEWEDVDMESDIEAIAERGVQDVSDQSNIRAHRLRVVRL